MTPAWNTIRRSKWLPPRRSSNRLGVAVRGYIRARKNLDAADKAFRAVASQAHAKGLGELEAEAYRQMALYQKEPRAALELLSKAADGLKEDKGNEPSFAGTGNGGCALCAGLSRS